MAGKSTTFENDLLKLIFNATAIGNIADNAAASPLTALYVSLHTADPTDVGNQSSNEVVYSGYSRMAILRSSIGWIVTASSVSPASNIFFPVAVSGSTTATHWAVGTLASGTGKILYSGAITPTLSITANVQPILTTASTVTEG